MKEKILAVIPARGGSKGVPRKNIKLLGGKPLIAYSIETGLASEDVDRLIVSTDDQEIAQVAAEHGAEVPFLRPAELAGDRTGQIDVVLHALKTMEEQGDCQYGYLLLLQPTAPFRSVDDIHAAVEMIQSTRCDSVIAYRKVESAHPYYMVTRDEASRTSPLMEIPPGLTARQQYPDVFLRNGAIYLTRRDVLIEQRSFHGQDSRAYIMPAERSVNIDSFDDFEMAEFILQKYGDRIRNE